jgi:hypothetical protein
MIERTLAQRRHRALIAAERAATAQRRAQQGLAPLADRPIGNINIYAPKHIVKRIIVSGVRCECVSV